MGEREIEVDSSSLDVLAKASKLVREGILSPMPQTRPSELPNILWDKILEMHGRGVMLVLEKRLCATDMKRDKGWFSIPKGKLLANFLTSEEIQTLDNKEAITASLIEPCLQVRRGLQLKKWSNKGKYFSYVLTKEWTAVAHPFERNRLKVGGLVQLWSFRANGDLCFCLLNVEAPPAAAENMANHEG